jgi:hypothetical protein
MIYVFDRETFEGDNQEALEDITETTEWVFNHPELYPELVYQVDTEEI